MKKKWYAAILAVTVLLASACQAASDGNAAPVDTQTAGEQETASTEPVTIACIGGSITQGTIAKGTSDDTVGFSRPYADIFREWWETQFPDTEITFVNAGIGGTDSYLGVHRLKHDILIDGESVRAINADFAGGWGNAVTAAEVYTSDEEAEHTVTIKKTEGTEKELFWLLGFLIS